MLGRMAVASLLALGGMVLGNVVLGEAPFGGAALAQAQQRLLVAQIEQHTHFRAAATPQTCALSIGPDVIHFSAYQAQQPETTTCEEIPAVGPVVLVVDYVDMELRNMLTDVRIVRDVAAPAASDILSEAKVAPEALDAITEEHVPPKLYPAGTIIFQHTFTRAGRYLGIITVRNDHGQIYVSGFPFSVGLTHHKRFAFYALMAAPLILGAIFYRWRSRWTKASAFRH